MGFWTKNPAAVQLSSDCRFKVWEGRGVGNGLQAIASFHGLLFEEYRPNHFGGRIRCESTIFAMYKITNIVNKEQCKKLPLNTYSTKRNIRAFPKL